jgi:hypothetical protein
MHERETGEESEDKRIREDTADEEAQLLDDSHKVHPSKKEE